MSESGASPSGWEFLTWRAKRKSPSPDGKLGQRAKVALPIRTALEGE